MNENPATNPYPALHPAIDDLRARVDRHDISISALTTGQAVTSEQMAGVRDDVRELTHAIGDANKMFKDELHQARSEFGTRFNRFLGAVAALVLVLLPIAIEAFKEAVK